MHIVLFDEILETHTVRSLAAALRDRGHRVTETGKVWRGHVFPTDPVEVARIGAALDEVLAAQPDVVFNFRASALPPDLLARMQQADVVSMVFLTDDPVLYGICYRHIVDFYDHVLHCGDESVLEFYEQRHGRSGVNFPFWAGESGWSDVAQLHPPEFDLGFLGNCVGPVRERRYQFVAGLPYRTRIFGRAETDPFSIVGGYHETLPAIARALTSGAAALSVPQFFEDYRGSKYDFPELAELGHFQFPSRVVQYARLGMPVVSLERAGPPVDFPEMITGRNRRELIDAVEPVIRDRTRLAEIGASTQQRWRSSFSAEARAVFVERLVDEPARWASASVGDRAHAFATILAESVGDAAVAQMHEAPAIKAVQVSDRHPSAAAQRQGLRATSAPRHRDPQRVVVIAEAGDLWSAGAAHRRAIEAGGHRVLHLDPLVHGLVAEPTLGAESESESIDIDVDVERLVPVLERFGATTVLVVGSRYRVLGMPPSIATVLVPEESEPIAEANLDRAGYDLVVDFGNSTSGSSPTGLHLAPGVDRHLVATDPPEDRTGVLVLRVAEGPPDPVAARLATRHRATVHKLDPSGSSTARDRSVLTRLSADHAVHVIVAQDRVSPRVLARIVVESAASGAAICCPRFAGLDDLFDHGEVIAYDDLSELVGVVDGLTSTTGASDALARLALARVIRDHTLDSRWRVIFETVSQLQGCDLGPLGDVDSFVPANAPRKVVIVGYYGAKNTGDELILRSLNVAAEASNPRIDLLTAAEDPAFVQRVHAIPAFSRTDLARADFELASASAVVLGGGGLWHDYSYRGAGGALSLFEVNHRSPTGWAKIPMLGAIHDRPFHVFGVGVGPLGPDAGAFVRMHSTQAESVCVRDVHSADLLTSIDGWTASVEVHPDPVFALDLEPAPPPPAVADLVGERPIVAVNLRPWSVDDLGPRVAHALETLARDQGVALVGVPMQGGDGQDHDVLARVFAMVDPDLPAFVLPWTEHYEELLGVLQASAAVLSMRLHSSLLAHRLGIPAVGLAYDPKVRLHFEELGVADRCLDLDAEWTTIAATTAQAMREPLPPHFSDRLREVERRARHGVSRLIERLASAPAPEATAPLRHFPDRGVVLASLPGPDDRVDLSTGEVWAGSTSAQSGRPSPVEHRSTITPAKVEFAIDRSDPRSGDFVEYFVPIVHAGQPRLAIELEVKSPYERARNVGRIRYEIRLDGVLLLTEDVALSGDLNQVTIDFEPSDAAPILAVRAVAVRDCEPWSWGRAGRIEIHSIRLSPSDESGPTSVRATSPASTLTLTP